MMIELFITLSKAKKLQIRASMIYQSKST